MVDAVRPKPADFPQSGEKRHSLETTSTETEAMMYKNHACAATNIVTGTALTLKQGASWQTWYKSVVDDLIVFEATEGPTEHFPLVFGVEIEV